MSDEIAPITLTTLYEMMMDLTRRGASFPVLREDIFEKETREREEDG